ncbi:MAG: transglycosylase domain-containing protein [Thermoleophilaceae bacterium]|nr:transglycosylase domain-containing protein [Thermoleophilaceae bacterium]
MTYRQRQSRRRKRQGPRSKVLLGLGVIATICLIAVCSAAGYMLAIAASAPDLGDLKADDKGEISVVYAADGSRLGFVQSDILRRVIPFADIPVEMRRATVAIEDERFWQHDGVDLNAIVRAGIRNLESGETVEGGSTITQQLVRALYIKEPKRNFTRKIREAKLASELEEKHSKTWILDNYLNSVPYGTVGGRTAIGVEAAAVTFFDKHASRLKLHEAALLAGLPQAPSEYNPFRNPTAAIERRNDVLDQMVENGYLTRAEAYEASRKGLGLRHGTRYIQRREPYFFDFVQEELIEKYGVGVVRRGGLKIHTTIKPRLQQAARDAINSHIFEGGPSSAIVTVDPSNGEIKAMASSGTYKARSFNLAAQGHRQPGSAFKTFVLTAAIRRGIDPDSTSYVSKPLNLNDDRYGPWQVKTYDGSYRGSMNLHRATLASDNTIYAQLIMDIGPRKVCQTAKLMGIQTKLDCYPAEGLGGLRLGVSPLEMAAAYATLASGGIRHRPTAIRKVVFPDGDVDKLSRPKGKRVLTDGEAYEVTRILEANIQSGTGRTASALECPAAGKTGTTDNHNDAWFVGYTPHLSTAVWLGYPDALISTGEQGGGTPTSIWTAYMQVAKGDDCSDFPPPKEPFVASPFHGKYASTGGATTSSGDYTSDPTTGGVTDYGTGEGYDPQYYEAPPQAAPPVQTPAAPQAPQVQAPAAPVPPPIPEVGADGQGGVAAPGQ